MFVLSAGAYVWFFGRLRRVLLRAEGGFATMSTVAFWSGNHLGMPFGLVAESGPFVPGASLTYALYAIMLLWLIATTTVMVFGSGGRHIQVLQAGRYDIRFLWIHDSTTKQGQEVGRRVP